MDCYQTHKGQLPIVTRTVCHRSKGWIRPLLRNYYVPCVIDAARFAGAVQDAPAAAIRGMAPSAAAPQILVTAVLSVTPKYSQEPTCRFGVALGSVSRNPVTDSPRNGHRMIPETLVIAADEGGVHSLFDTV